MLITVVLLLLIFANYSNTYDNIVPVIELERYDTDYWIYFNVTDIDWVRPAADYKIILTGGENYVGFDMMNLDEPYVYSWILMRMGVYL